MCRYCNAWVLSGLVATILLATGFRVARADSPPDSPSANQAQSSPGADAATSSKGSDKQGGRLEDPEGILNLDIDQLSKVNVVAPSLSMEVSTVERTESTVGRTPAAVFVITNEMIRRSGVRTIPDALRLAPGVDVEQKTANQWSITIRGFSSVYADKLLVQIDGRTVYTSLFGGVYWDVQDLVLEDIERIEVIRGPGGTLWGANAVNGVINIITKSSKETQGGYFQGATGNELRGMATARYGGKLGENATYRMYGKWFEQDSNYDPDGYANDGWRQGRTGFRYDWTPQASDAFTLQGDAYNGYSGREGTIGSPTPPFQAHYSDNQHVSGENILGRWTHVIDKDSDWSLQWYYDRNERHETELPWILDYNTFDIDFQHRFPLTDNHALIWGAGYRNYSDFTRGIPMAIQFNPSSRTDDLYSCFIQDQMTIREDQLYFILGSKFEHNDYTGFEMQPTARILWTPDKKHTVWGAVSRAVQTPTRLSENGLLMKEIDTIGGVIPVFTRVSGDPDVESTDVIAYELGMRAQPTKAFYWDLALFYNDYSKLMGAIPGIPYPDFTSAGYPMVWYPGTCVTDTPGETYGFELAAGYELNERWKLRAAYSFLRIQIHEPAGTVPYFEENEPRNQYYLWLTGDLGHHWFLDTIGRYFDDEHRYFVADVRLAWRPRDTFEWSVVGRNLLDGPHYETTGRDIFGVSATEVQPEVYTAITYRF